MTSFDDFQLLHKKYYYQLLDEYDKDLIAKILANPNCEEAQFLNKRVDIKIQNEIKSLTTK
jgi:hypothetical protein